MSKPTNTIAQNRTVTDLITRMTPAFQMALGTPKMAERFARVALTLIRTNPNLEKCSDVSLMGSLMMAAQLKLEMNLGSAYIVPYWSGKLQSFEAQFQIGYQGYIELFYRHPLAEELYAEIVYRNDEFKIVKGTKREIVHNPVLSEDRGDPIGYYAVARLKTGAFNFAYMSVSEVKAHRQRYAPAKHSAWDSDFDAMALKTCIKKTLKLMPRSVEISTAVSFDEGIKRPATMDMAMDIESIPTLFPENNPKGIGYSQPEQPTPPKKAKPAPKKAAEPEPTTEEAPLPEEFPQDEVRQMLLKDIAATTGDWLSPKDRDAWKKAVESAEYVADVYTLKSSWDDLTRRNGDKNDQKTV
jgi:recombination protein RecT